MAAAAETMLLTIFLRHDQSNNLDAIQARLKKGQPSIVGITYIPSNAITPGGSLREPGEGVPRAKDPDNAAAPYGMT